jgi:hypothetical protein
MRRALLITLSLLSATVQCFPQVAVSGSIRGQVFTTANDHTRSLVPGIRVALRGLDAREAESDASGRYAFDSVLPGAYTIEVSASGLHGSMAVEVKPGETTVADVELTVAELRSSVTVAATNPGLATESAQSTTIGESTVENAPNRTEHFDSLLPLVPGVVRGPDGRINMKGSRSNQGGWLVNSANVTDPATGDQAINLPIDVVSSVQVISNPYNPEYGKFAGAISSVETRTSNFEKFHVSVQNLMPRARERDGDIVGLESVTPRLTVTGPIVPGKVAFTQSIEYRFLRNPVESLPPLRRDNKLESFNSFTQLDLKLSEKQTATLSLAVFPQRLNYLGLNTFTPQPSTPDLHQRGIQTSLQDRVVIGDDGLLTSQVNYGRFNADVTANSTDPYRLLVETTEGGFFSLQKRRSNRFEWQEMYQSGARHFLGSHVLKVGFDLTHSSYNGRQQFLPVDIVGTAGYALERVEFGRPAVFSRGQNEFAWFVGDEWSAGSRVMFDLGLRFDQDSVTDSTHTAPRVGVNIALTRDHRTLLKAGAGLFYDRVPLNIPEFPSFPNRTILALDSAGQVLSSTPYANAISGSIRNPRSSAWNLELDRQVFGNLLVRAAYQRRNTRDSFVVTPAESGASLLQLSNGGRDSYQELQLTGVYRFRRGTLNASYVRSRAYGDLNDFNRFFGSDPQVVIQPNARARLPFDAPNRWLSWSELELPKKTTLIPVLDVHTGFPYSVEDQLRGFVGPRDSLRFRAFWSLDVQVVKEVRLPFLGKERREKVGFGVFNVMNHFDPRDVQSILDSARFGTFFNGTPRAFRGKFEVVF